MDLTAFVSPLCVVRTVVSLVLLVLLVPLLDYQCNICWFPRQSSKWSFLDYFWHFLVAKWDRFCSRRGTLRSLNLFLSPKSLAHGILGHTRDNIKVDSNLLAENRFGKRYFSRVSFVQKNVFFCSLLCQKVRIQRLNLPISLLYEFHSWPKKQF